VIANIKKYFINFNYAVKIIFTASKKYFLLKTLMSVVSSLLPYIPLLLWRELINALSAFDIKKTDDLIRTIWWLVVLYCLIILVEKLLQTVSNYIIFKYEDEINYYLDNLMVDRVSSVDMGFFDCSDLKDHLNNSWSLIYSTKKMVTFVFDMIQGFIRLGVSFALLLTLSLWMIPVAILLCIPSIVWDNKIEKIDYQFLKKHGKTQRKLGYYKDLFFGEERQEIRLYQLKDYFSSLYDRVWQEWNITFLKKERNRSVLGMFSAIIVTINELIVYIFSIAKLIAGRISVGDVTYYVSLVTQFKDDFNAIAYRINSFNRSVSELNDVREFVEMKPLLEKTGQMIPSKNPVIEFKNVSFHYPNTDKYVLRNCSFVIPFGKTIGLVGSNGSGKSTIVKLICRFYDPTEGQILIDGVDTREYDIVKLRALFGVLFQDYVKYSFSLRENISLSDISKAKNNSAIMEAAIQSHVSDFIRNWERGIDENLTRRFDPEGKELSGGQWQRVSLARAFFRDAPVVLLDEPSAALDPAAEYEIFEDFANVSEGKSAILISHRLSSITLCDNILVLEEGYIIEQGSHKELIEKNGKYAHLFNLQASKYM